MVRLGSFSSYLLPSAQALAVVVAMALVTAMPPSQGRILILSFGSESESAIARWAVESDALIIGRGPIAGSLVVWGPRARLFKTALRHRALLFTAAASGCGVSNA